MTRQTQAAVECLLDIDDAGKHREGTIRADGPDAALSFVIAGRLAKIIRGFNADFPGGATIGNAAAAAYLAALPADQLVVLYWS
jgi:hypothetical protein